MAYSFVVKVQTNNEVDSPSGLVYDERRHRVFHTTVLSEAVAFAKDCAKNNNQMYKPIYTVCRLETIFTA